MIVPRNNEDETCWLRVNDDPGDNATEDKSLVVRGRRYYWHEGEGVVFDDTYLHDAANESDDVRVVLWLDLLKPLPWYLTLASRLFLWFAHRDESVAKIHRNARIG